MEDVMITGVGQTPVAEHWDIGLRDLAFAAIQDAIHDAGGIKPQAIYIGNMLAPNLSNQAHLGALFADFSGLTGIEAVTVEAADASGGAALRQGYLAVKSGLVQTALVLGVEKMTDKIGSSVQAALATTGDADYEAVQGVTPTVQAAMTMQRYIHEHDMPIDGFAGFALTAHKNGTGNPDAMYRSGLQLEAYSSAEKTSDPMNIYDVAPRADGAAALILTRSDLLPSNPHEMQVRIAGSSSAVDTLALHDRKDLLYFEAVQLAAGKAMKQEGVLLEDIDLFEYHDSFSIYAALALESVGFAIRGKGWKLAAEGEISIDGRIPCATMGGLKARGFPGGATGVYQAVEAVIQLRGNAGVNQVKDASCALLLSMGGPGSTGVCHILRTRRV
ncbi:MAG: acetyl-CoA acetyltransferase [Chloroflexi bacterium RBG_16_51_16]|nr:MAG: acetyl-CoA acetyltransferase [Chloroflexi bacterium RBG_16_51_16]